jgi:TolA-binding protein
MYNRIFKCLFLLLVGLAIATPASAEDKKVEEPSKEEVKPAPAAKDTAKVKVSSAFLNRWKKIQKVTKKQAYETQQTRTVAGVRGAEAEDAVLDQLYYKGGVRYPSRVDLKNAISQLQEAIKADPDAKAVPEQKYFIAQCHSQLGETDIAKATYNDLIKNHSGTDWAREAQAEIDKFADQ